MSSLLVSDLGADAADFQRYCWGWMWCVCSMCSWDRMAERWRIRWVQLLARLGKAPVRRGDEGSAPAATPASRSFAQDETFGYTESAFRKKSNTS